MRARPPFAVAVLAGVGAILACFLVWPLVESLRGAFFDSRGRATLVYVGLVLANPDYREGFAHAFAVGVGSTLLAAVLGLYAAFVVDRWSFPGKRALEALVPLPLLVPPFVGAIGMKQLFGQAGALNALLADLGLASASRPIDWLRDGRFWAVVVLTAFHLYPIVYFNASAALAGVHPDLEHAAETLGCTGLRKFRRVTLPLILPSVLAALTIVFLWSLTELGVPLMCDYTRITSVQIFSGLKDIGRNPFVHALVAIVLFVTLALYGLAQRLFGRARRAAVSGVTKGVARRVPSPLGPWSGIACSLSLGAVVLCSILPNLSVVLVSLADDWYRTVLPSRFTLAHYADALGHDMVVPSIRNSLRYVALSTAIDVVLGVAVALVLVRSRHWAAKVIDAVVMLPLVVPGLVMAFGYLAISRDGGPLAFLNPARDPTPLLVAAYAIRRLPFVVRAAAAGFTVVGAALEEAARSLGASARSTFRRITLPLVGPHLVAGALLAFALSMLEVSDSLILAQRKATYPITKAIYELTQLLGEGRYLAAALGVWAMVLLAVATQSARSALGGAFGSSRRE